MSYDKRKKALRYLMFLKKIDGTLKARGCADSRLQKNTNKEDTSSPTISIEAMMLSCAIDAKENRYVIVSNIPGAFLHADMEDNVHILLEGTVAEMMVKLDSTVYRKHKWYNKHGKPMLYVQLKNSLYGALQAALLFWKLLSETGHVNNLKILHIRKDIDEYMLDQLNNKFGKESPLTTCQGKVIEYLSKKIDYSQQGKVKFIMYE